MIIQHRHFFIPETKLDKKWCLKQQELTQMGIFVNNRQMYAYTEKSTDNDLLRGHIQKQFDSFYIEVMSVRKSNVNSIMEAVNSDIDIVVDIRGNPQSNKNMTMSTLKTKLRSRGIMYEWLPQLGINDTRKIGKYKLDDLFRKHRKFLFIGNSKYVLDKLCNAVKKQKLKMLGEINDDTEK